MSFLFVYKHIFQLWKLKKGNMTDLHKNSIVMLADEEPIDTAIKQ
jgi:hypothetical protein